LVLPNVVRAVSVQPANKGLCGIAGDTRCAIIINGGYLMNKIETSTMSFYKMELEEIKTLEIGDEIAICLKLNPPEKVEFVGAKVTRPLFWNSDADEPSWELETNNGFVDPDSVWGITTPYPVRSFLDEEEDGTKDFFVTVSKTGVAKIKAKTREEAKEKADAMKSDDYIWESGFVVDNVR